MTLEARLAGKVALITGAARGIGEAIARTFALHGAVVVIGDIRDEPGTAVARDIGTAASFQHLDVRDVHSWETTVADMERRFGDPL